MNYHPHFITALAEDGQLRFCSPGRIEYIRFETVFDDEDWDGYKPFTYIKFENVNREYWTNAGDYRHPLLFAFTMKGTIQVKAETCDKAIQKFEIFKILNVDRMNVKYII